jgi:alkylation response protein AidB-like acyl-CoA dehydrogenase
VTQIQIQTIVNPTYKFLGKKFICLAISEAQTGSDIFGLHTTATKTEDGKHWIVNGSKKWITNGM